MNFILSYITLLSFFFYFERIGSFLSIKIFEYRFNKIINIYFGLGLFISIINLSFIFGINNFKIILFLIIANFSLLLLKFYKQNNFNFNFNLKINFLIFLSLVLCLLIFNHPYSNHDDINGYFNIYASIINDNYNSTPDSNIRNFYSSYGYNFIQSIFIFIGGYSSAYFFDQAFGGILILLSSYYLLKYYTNDVEFAFLIILIFLSLVTISETSMPKVIIYSISLLILFELKKFIINSKPEKFFVIIGLLFIAYNLRYNYILSFICFSIIFIFFFKLIKKEFNIIKNLKIIFLLVTIFLVPEFIQKFLIFKTISPIFGSEFYITENNYFNEIKIINTDIKYFYFLTKIFLKKHFIFICLVFWIISIIKLKNQPYLSLLFFTYLLSIIIMSFVQIPDYQNPKRYLVPVENSLIIFLLILIFNDLKEKIYLNKINRNFIFIFFLIFGLIVSNISLSNYRPSYNLEFYKSRLKSVINIFNSNYKNKETFFYKEKIFTKKNNLNYIDDFNSCYQKLNLNEKVLIITKHSYLFYDKQFKAIDYRYGFTLSEFIYPIFQEFVSKEKFFKQNYKSIIIEKNILFENKNLNDYLLNKDKILFNNNLYLKNFNPTWSKFDQFPLIAWYDLVSFFYEYAQLNKKKLNCNNNFFISIKF